ncbi:Phytanoyl-CoA dioxygenase [Penicillium chermesinum]|uniref:Phytanoyl-CoA dioxygenase n=1 Tax=Penicillium chermesinum TaxID=63820 RepID=A0A9W9PHQ8_9EURO|nr:Phytanoyl-CoA dioxygenase [Penicillium chermesinum]KAJ5246377.1 Phytanoyl-CoA dioxygenase [Penicillium chermesinum]
MSTPHLDALQRDGFVVVRNLLTPSQITEYRAAAIKVTTKTRTGGWPHFRTVPKQFPPWPSTPPPASEGGIWGVQHLLHPEMEGRELFARCYFSPSILGVVEELLGVQGGSDEQLVMELFNLLVAPETKDFELRWHRDDIPETASAEEEVAQLAAKSPRRAPYNLALCPDASLIVVPGSHRRARTEVERSAGPYEATLPGQLVVELQPGDAVFYDSNILHRGVYKGKAEGGEETRLTLHGSFGLKADGEGDAEKMKVRATAVLQHGVGAWVKRDDAAFGIGERPEKMRANLVAMGSGRGLDILCRVRLGLAISLFLYTVGEGTRQSGH